jgi:hypothetical protein
MTFLFFVFEKKITELKSRRVFAFHEIFSLFTFVLFSSIPLLSELK